MTEPRRAFSSNQPRQQPPMAAGSVIHPSFKGAARYEVEPRKEGDEAATGQTISLMRTLAEEDSRHPAIQAAADIATAGARQRADAAAGIFRWIKARVLFREDSETAAPLAGILDPADAEVLIRPVDLLNMDQPAGDCDDFATLTASMLLAADIRPEFRTIAADPESPDYSHVYCRAILPGGRVMALDTSHGPEPGWEYPQHSKAKSWSFPRMKRLGAMPDWGIDLLKIGAQTGSQIATARYAQPPAGTYKTGADGSVYYRQPEGASALAFPGAGINVGGGSTFSLLLVAGAVALLIGVLKR